jgi:hypothetical protein
VETYHRESGGIGISRLELFRAICHCTDSNALKVLGELTRLSGTAKSKMTVVMDRSFPTDRQCLMDRVCYVSSKTK